MAGKSWGEFLNEKESFTSGPARLKNWKENGSVVVWIHTKTQIHKRLFHMLPYVTEREDEKTKKKRNSISYFPFVCHETVANYKNKDVAPISCPVCRFTEYLKTNGSIEDNETVWDSSVGDRKRDRVCTKADFTGDTEGGGDWRLSFKPSLQYILAVIDNDNVDDGIQVATEKWSIGEGIKKAVGIEIERKGPELGDPDQNPYAFKFKFDDSAKKSSDYYTVFPYDQAELTDEIRELLDAPEVDLTKYISPGDTSRLREIMEAHVTVDDVNFDELFDNILPNQGAASDSDSEEPTEPKNTPSKDNQKKQQSTPKPEPESELVDDDNQITCPSCQGHGKKRGKECKVCDGTGKIEAPEEEEDEKKNVVEPDPEPPKQQRKTRSVTKTPDPEPEIEEEMAECGRCKKDVPMSAESCPHCGASFQ